MENMALKAAAIVFLLVSIMHLARLIFKVKVTVEDFVVPLWYSIFGFVIATSLATWMFKAIK